MTGKVFNGRDLRRQIAEKRERGREQKQRKPTNNIALTVTASMNHDFGKL